ncbi:MAG: ArsR family transcriptional regulator [Rhodobacteraceae bacterium]|jgi:DNA-binding transcriptional ArsR family regulator|nr:ArsR family transcriptional regulator [Paracoccaceae bacterium]
MKQAPDLSAVFAALADPTRRAILGRLAGGEVTVGELARPFALSQPAVSRHLRVLQQAGLVEAGRRAQTRPRRLSAAGLRLAYDWLAAYRGLWEDRFARLDALLAALPDAAEGAPHDTATTAPARPADVREPPDAA